MRKDHVTLDGDVLLVDFCCQFASDSFDPVVGLPYAEYREISSSKEDAMTIRKVVKITKGLCKCKSSC